MVLNAKFWSFPIHTYQKQLFLITILAVKGHGKNLVIDRNSIVKNVNLKILTKTHVIYLKRKLRTCKMQIHVEKVWFVAKKMEKNNFQKKIFKIEFFSFFSNKSYFFNLNLHFICSELSFEVYNMSFGEIFQIFNFYYRIPINNQVLSATSHG